MTINIDSENYEVVIERKNNKNTYIRVKQDLKIYITTSYFATKSTILKIINSNITDINKMIEKQKNRLVHDELFFYLEKKYDIIIVSSMDGIEFDGSIIYVKNMDVLNKWKNEEIIRIFDERYIHNYNRFKENNIKSPILKIRNMKTRWGVYNRKNNTITLNSKLIEYDIEKIDYVIIHELSHIIHFNHSKDFWNLVSRYCPNYKTIRLAMKE